MAEQAAGNTKGETFGRFLKSALIIDAILILFLTFGFVWSSKLGQDPHPGALPAALYDDSAKLSPFTPPPPEPAQQKVEIPLLTMRGEHPTLELVQPEPAADTLSVDSSLAAPPAEPVRVPAQASPHTT